MEIKTKINKWDVIKLEGFCTAKEITNKVKRKPSEWEKIIAREPTDRELIYKIYKQIIQLNTGETNRPIKKWEKKTWTDISPKKTYKWLTNTWKDAQHHSLWEKCKLKLHWDTTTHQSEWPSSKSLQTNSGEGAGKREPSCVAGKSQMLERVWRKGNLLA